MPFTPGRPLAEAKADLFKALAHPARIRVPGAARRGRAADRRAGRGTGLELSHLSQQVSVLRRAGIVGSRRVRNNVICSLCDPQTAELLAVARRMLTANLRQGQALLDALDGADDAVALADSARARS